MRRRRQTLHVSTFPFLAVLLCTMGSLILVLLIIDCRGRAAALQRAQQEAARQADQAAQQADARRQEKRRLLQAAWEEKQRSQHQRLLSEKDELQAQMNALRRQMTEVAARLRYEQASDEELREKMKSRRGEVDQAERVLTSSRANAAGAAGKVSSSNRELARMTADLLRLQQVLTDLVAARSKAKQTYSVVPYRGRRGESRRPLYIECTAQGVTFHPDRLTVPVSLHSYLLGDEKAPAGAPLDVHEEVVRRIGKLKEAMARTGLAMDKPPYLLLLVRPDGIESYYRIQNALKDLNVQYGYELIDADWVLDFPPDDAAPTDQAWMHAARNPVAPPLPQSGNSPRPGPQPHSAMLTPNGDKGGSPGLYVPGQAARGSGVVGGTPGGTSTGGSGWGVPGAIDGRPSPGGMAWGNAGGTGGPDAGGSAGLPGGGGNPGGGAGQPGGRRIVGLAPAWPGASGGGGSSTGSGMWIPGQGPGLGGGGSGGGGPGSGGGYSGQTGSATGSGLATLVPGLSSGSSGPGSGTGMGLAGSVPGFDPGSRGQGAGSGAPGSGPTGAGTGPGQPGGVPGFGPGSGAQATGAGPGVPGVPGRSGSAGLGAPIATSAGGSGGLPGFASDRTGVAGGVPGQPGGASSPWAGQPGGPGTGFAGVPGRAGGTPGQPGTAGTMGGSGSGQGDGQGTGQGMPGSPAGGSGGAPGQAGALAGTTGAGGGMPGQPGVAGSTGAAYGDRSLSAGARQGAGSGTATAWNGQPGRGGAYPRQRGDGSAQPPADGQEQAQPDDNGEPGQGQPQGDQNPQNRTRTPRRRRSGPHGINWANNGGAGGDDSDDDDEERPMDVLPGGPPQAKPRPKPRVLRPASIHGSRDYVIFIECQYDGLTLYPSRQRFIQAQLDQPPAYNPLLQALVKTIQRRQALVRPGEPPYRPQVRFLVRQDGMRCFHAANSLVEALGVPRTQQPLAWSDDVMAIISESH